MERTISAMIGKGSVNHNTRAFTAKNVDKNRSADNVEFCQEDIKQVYHKLFDEAQERYNAKQKRNRNILSSLIISYLMMCMLISKIGNSHMCRIEMKSEKIS